MKISLFTARKLALHCQGLDGEWAPPSGKEGIAQTIERLGYLQIDTIAVVRRAHHHTLWVRRPDYDPQMLHELQAKDRRFFEWWAPAMSYVPMADYRYFMAGVGRGSIRRWKRRWFEENQDVVEGVLERIRQEGPLGSKDFKAPEGHKRGTWWSWKPAKEALEVLFDMGELVVSERRNFQRIYDLRERVIPDWVDRSEPSAEEVEQFRARRVLGGRGFAPVDGVRWGWGRRSAASPEAVQALVDTGEVTQFEIEGLEGAFCALTARLNETMGQTSGGAHVHILSPFDNLVIRRGWLREYFDFSYKLEAYTPAAKRKYGYFCHPVLWGERFVGRMDAKADRKAKTFIVRKLIFEPGFAEYEGFWPGFTQKLEMLMTFSGCERIVIEQTDPEKAKVPLERALGLA